MDPKYLKLQMGGGGRCTQAGLVSGFVVWCNPANIGPSVGPLVDRMPSRFSG